MTTQPSALPRRRGLRPFSLFLAAVAFLTTAVVGVGVAAPAQALFSPTRVLPTTIGAANGIKGLIANPAGVSVAAGSTTAAEVAGGATVAAGGVGIVAAASGIALAAGAGAAIGWAGFKGYGFVKDKWFTTHPLVNEKSWAGVSSNIADIKVTGVTRGSDAPWGLSVGLTVTVKVQGANPQIKMYWADGTGTRAGILKVLNQTGNQCPPNPDGSWSACTRSYVSSPDNFPGDVNNIKGLLFVITDADGVNLDLDEYVPLEGTPTVWQLHTDTTCQTSTGPEVTVNNVSGGFHNLTEAPQLMPEATCAGDAHAVEVHAYALTNDPDVSPSRVPLLDWSADPKFRDVNDPDAKCMALAGASQCDLDPGTKDAPTCTWGGRALADAECTTLRDDPGAAPETPVGPTPGGAGQPDPGADGADCFPTGWGMLNPLEWVLKPTKCALVWAFVPSPTTTGALDGIGVSLQGKTPAPELASLFAWLKIPSVPSQCFKVQVAVPAMMGGSVQAIDSCGDDLFISWLKTHRGLLEVVVWIGFASPLAWWAWRQYAPGSQGVA